jgi:hypothetical protein
LKNAGFSIEFQESWGFIPVDRKFPFLKEKINLLAKKLNLGDVIFVIARKL